MTQYNELDTSILIHEHSTLLGRYIDKDKLKVIVL